MTGSSAKITWKRISTVPTNPDLSNYYEYVIEYKQGTSSTWQELLRRKHSETTSSTQSDPLTDLTHSTEYDVRLTSYRVVRTTREETGSESRTFTTEDKGKNTTFLKPLFKSIDLGSAKAGYFHC